jgi:hypothetical protein
MDMCGEEMKKNGHGQTVECEGILLGKYVSGYKSFVTGLSVHVMTTRDE